jgi:hypothetical protein
MASSIRNKLKTPPQAIKIDSVGEEFYFKKLSGKELLALFTWGDSVPAEQAILPDHDLNWKARVIASSLCDKDGKQEYTHSEDDLNAVLSVDADILTELYNVAAQRCGLVAGKEEEKAVKN